MKKLFAIKRKTCTAFLCPDMTRETCDLAECVRFDTIEGAYGAIEDSLKTSIYEVYPFVYIDCDLHVAGNVHLEGGVFAGGDVTCFSEGSSGETLSHTGWKSSARKVATRYGIKSPNR